MTSRPRLRDLARPLAMILFLAAAAALWNQPRLLADETLPAAWQSSDIGAVGAAGDASFAGGVFTVQGAGADIWGTADALHFAYRTLSGNFDIVAQVTSVENIDRWTKAGLMVRNSLDPDSAHVSLLATPSGDRGLAVQARGADGSESVQRRRWPGIAPPVWVKLMRRGNTVQAAYRLQDSVPWTEFRKITVSLEDTVLVGFAVSSHVDGTLASATFADVSVADADLPAGISSADVGAVRAAGGAAFIDGAYRVDGSGSDIWGASDEFHWAYTAATGDFAITARVTEIEPLDRWVKAGLMVRETTQPDSRHVSLFSTPFEKGLAFQRRTTTGGQTTHTAGPDDYPPVWLQLERTGDVITASYKLADANPWILIGNETLPGLPNSIYVGLAVSSHHDGALATAMFDQVDLAGGELYASADIGRVGVPGTTVVMDESVIVEGSGADIWGTADAFRYVYQPWSGDGTITVHVASLENTNAWTKAGVMFRESLAPGAKHAMAIVSPLRGIAMQYRAETGGVSANAGARAGAAPQWLRLQRAGNTFTGSTSEDGVTWQTIGTTSIAMNADILVGLPVTSHNNTTLASAAFDSVDVTP